MFGAIEKVAIATGGTAAAFIAADKLDALPGYFAGRTDEAQQRRNSFVAGVVAGGVVASIVLLAWRNR